MLIGNIFVGYKLNNLKMGEGSRYKGLPWHAKKSFYHSRKRKMSNSTQRWLKHRVVGLTGLIAGFVREENMFY